MWYLCLYYTRHVFCHDIGGHVTERLENRKVILAFEVRMLTFKPWLYHLWAV